MKNIYNQLSIDMHKEYVGQLLYFSWKISIYKCMYLTYAENFENVI